MVHNDTKLLVNSILIICLLLISMWISLVGVVPKNVVGQDHNFESITSNTIWYAENNPHNVTGTVYVLGKNLTINSGVLIKLNTSLGVGGITIDNLGRLFALGTPTNPITLTSNESSPKIGDWNGIIFKSNSQGGILKNCRSYYTTTGIDIQGGSVLIENSNISNSNTGIFIKGGSVNINNTEIFNAEEGIKIKSDTPVIKNVTLDHCNYSLWTEKSITLENCTIINSII